MELEQINEYQVHIDHGVVKYDPNQRESQMHLRDTKKSRYTWVIHVNMMDITKPDY